MPVPFNAFRKYDLTKTDGLWPKYLQTRRRRSHVKYFRRYYLIYDMKILSFSIKLN